MSCLATKKLSERPPLSGSSECLRFNTSSPKTWMALGCKSSATCRDQTALPTAWPVLALRSSGQNDVAVWRLHIHTHTLHFGSQICCAYMCYTCRLGLSSHNLQLDQCHPMLNAVTVQSWWRHHPAARLRSRPRSFFHPLGVLSLQARECRKHSALQLVSNTQFHVYHKDLQVFGLFVSVQLLKLTASKFSSKA